MIKSYQKVRGQVLRWLGGGSWESQIKWSGLAESLAGSQGLSQSWSVQSAMVKGVGESGSKGQSKP